MDRFEHYLRRHAKVAEWLNDCSALSVVEIARINRMFGVPVAIFGVRQETSRLEKRFKRWLGDSADRPRLLAPRRRLRAAIGSHP